LEAALKDGRVKEDIGIQHHKGKPFHLVPRHPQRVKVIGFGVAGILHKGTGQGKGGGRCLDEGTDLLLKVACNETDLGNAERSHDLQE
jgi:hypothetical protein